jgi:hypothetical protein
MIKIGLTARQVAAIHYRNRNRPVKSLSLWKTLDERLELHVHRTSTCWIWIGNRSHQGYGTTTIDQSPRMAHRLWWSKVNGPIPKGMFVCHKCDNPSCVNPAHLFLGTPKDNSQDMVRKGRVNRPIGDRHPQAKLRNCDVREIRRLSLTGLTHTDLGKRYGVCASSICLMVSGKTWKIDV